MMEAIQVRLGASIGGTGDTVIEDGYATAGDTNAAGIDNTYIFHSNFLTPRRLLFTYLYSSKFNATSGVGEH